ncbi:threonine/serine exporter family protein [Fusobacterium perfoetens]|uniref:threonine/serine exporter family protein n=1 Tax=Fusobacterium perfoetens TaxID=852 RepID=UPI0004842786|nr:threonine/serine exporter family protein [Fusobacterium perfoetens]MCI6151678.1 threonine/serine exporter family protein [Fusobacterium perfoetens]MDY3236566.1 threonine/serine exporter family protein [Fusobacterium perfoetens]
MINNFFFQIIAAIITTFGFGIIFNIKNINLFYTSIGGGISWFIFLLGKSFFLNDGLNYFFATLTLAIYSEIIARKLKTPVTTILIAGLIPLAPGGDIYYTIYYFINRNYYIAVEKGISTFIIAGAMAIGVFSAANLTKIFKYLKNK